MRRGGGPGREGTVSARPPHSAGTYASGEGAATGARALAAEFLDRAAGHRGEPTAGRVAEAVLLAVSELVTNAVKYAPGPCLLDLWLEDSTVAVSVWDTSCDLPVFLPPDPARVGRQGGVILRRIAADIRVERAAGGKRITVRIPWRDKPGAP